MGKTFLESHLEDIVTEASEEKTSGLGTNDMQSATSMIQSLKIGDWEIRNHTVAILDLKHVEIAYQKKEHIPPDAIIGSDLLLKSKALINYGKLSLTLY